jgi:hypothetical protein
MHKITQILVGLDTPHSVNRHKIELVVVDKAQVLAVWGPLGRDVVRSVDTFLQDLASMVALQIREEKLDSLGVNQRSFGK